VFHDTPAGLDAFIDFHSTVPDYTGDGVYNTGEEHSPLDFGYIDIAGGKANAAWWQNFRALQPDTYQWQGGCTTSPCYTTTGYARNSLGAAVDVTFETQFSWERNIDYYHQEGENFGIAFYQAWVPQVDGDFTGDGVVDARDYLLWRTTAGQTGPALAADANRDNVVDATDYNIWRAHFGQSAAGAALGESAATPEPTTCSLICLAAFTFAASRFSHAKPQGGEARVARREGGGGMVRSRGGGGFDTRAATRFFIAELGGVLRRGGDGFHGNSRVWREEHGSKSGRIY
jgi:hypothetical protein